MPSRPDHRTPARPAILRIRLAGCLGTPISFPAMDCAPDHHSRTPSACNKPGHHEPNAKRRSRKHDSLSRPTHAIITLPQSSSSHLKQSMPGFDYTGMICRFQTHGHHNQYKRNSVVAGMQNHRGASLETTGICNIKPEKRGDKLPNPWAIEDKRRNAGGTLFAQSKTASYTISR